MKKSMKWTHSMPVKLFAAFLAICCITGTVGTTIGAFIYHKLPKYKEMVATRYQNIADNYSAYIIAEYQSGNTSVLNNGILEDTNLHFAMVQGMVTELEQLDLEDPSVYLVGTPEDAKRARYTFHGSRNRYYHYNTTSIWSNVLDSNSAYTMPAVRSAQVDVDALFFATDTQRLYLYTKQGAYPVTEIEAGRVIEVSSQLYAEMYGDGPYETVGEAPANSEETVEVYTPEEADANINHDNASRSGSVVEIDSAESLAAYMELVNYAFALGDSYYGVIQDHFTYSESQQGYVNLRGDLLSQRDLELVRTITVYDLNGDTTFFERGARGGAVFNNYDIPFATGSLKELGTVKKEAFYVDGPYISLPESDQNVMNFWVLSWLEEPLMVKDDLFAICSVVWTWLYLIGKNAMYLQILFLIGAIATLAIFAMGVGHRMEDDAIHLRFVDRIPFALLVGLALAPEIILVMLAIEMLHLLDSLSMICILSAEAIFAGGAIAMLALASTIVRFKGKAFWRYTLCGYLMMPVTRFARSFTSQVDVVVKKGLIWLGATIAEIVILALMWEIAYGSIEFVLVMLFIIELIKGAFILRTIAERRYLRQQAQAMASGEEKVHIDLKRLHGDYRDLGENLNRIDEGMMVAVEKQIRSERFRTELITNVSHDIRTPLTSIINYVDLIKREDFANPEQNPKLAEYISVLDRHSGRLKKLIEDLIEASKASSGTLKVAMEPTNVEVLLQQATAEFEERLEKSQLTPVITCPPDAREIMADGRHLWRVFDNLLGNICKYALAGTRVYITMEQESIGSRIDADGSEQDLLRTRIIFRNISAHQLNISSDELMERFVRGDSSRNTEGSGLGLSIAESLMKLMKGELKLDVDGDLFKATLIFEEIGDGGTIP